MASTECHQHPSGTIKIMTAAFLALLFLISLPGPAWQVRAMNAPQPDLSYEDTWRLQIQDLYAPIFSSSPLTDSKGNPRGPGLYNDAPGVGFSQNFMYIWDPYRYQGQLPQIYDPENDAFLLSDDQVFALLPYPADLYFMPVNEDYFAFRYVNPSPYPILNCVVELISRSHPDRNLYIYDSNIVLPGQLSPMSLSDLSLYDEDCNRYSADLDDLVFAGYSISYLDANNGLVTLEYDPQEQVVQLSDYNDYYSNFYPAGELESTDYAEFMENFFPKQDSLVISNTFDRDIIEIFAILIGDNGAELRLTLPLSAGLSIPPGAKVDLGDFLVWPGNVAFPGYDYIFVEELNLVFAGNDDFVGEDTYLFYLPSLDLVMWDHYPDLGDFGEFSSAEEVLGDTGITESYYLEPNSLIMSSSVDIEEEATLNLPATRPRSTLPAIEQETQAPVRSTMPTLPSSDMEESHSELPGINDETDPFALIELQFPQPGPELAAVEAIGAMAVRSYLVARVYWQQVMDFNLDDRNNFDVEAYTELLDHAQQAFANAQAFADLFDLAASHLTDLEFQAGYNAYAVPGSVEYSELGLNDAFGRSSDEKMKLSVINGPIFDLPAGGGASGQGLLFFDSAEKKQAEEERKAALAWAEKVVSVADKARCGQKMKTLAAYLGTDCRRAFLTFKQANDMIVAAAEGDYGDYCNTAYQAAKGAEAAGAAAQFGLAIVCPPVGAIQKIGVGVSAVSTVLTIGSAGATIYNNGEDNVVSDTMDSIQSRMGPVSEAFAILDLGMGAKGLLDSGKELFKGQSGKEALKLLTRPEGAKFVQDSAMLGVSGLSYITNEVMNYKNNNQILSGVWTATPEGLKFTLMDTFAGRDPAQLKAIEEGLKAKGYEPEELPASVRTGSREDVEAPLEQEQISPELGQQILERNQAYDPASGVLSREELEDVLDSLKQLMDQIYEQASAAILEANKDRPDENVPVTDSREAALLGTWRWDYIADGMLGEDLGDYDELKDMGFKLEFYLKLMPAGKIDMDYEMVMPMQIAGFDGIEEQILKSIFNMSYGELKDALAHSHFSLKGDDELVLETDGYAEARTIPYTLDGDTLRLDYGGRTFTYIRTSEAIAASTPEAIPYQADKPLIGIWQIDVIGLMQAAGAEELVGYMQEYLAVGGKLDIYFVLNEDSSFDFNYNCILPVGANPEQQEEYDELVRNLELRALQADLDEMSGSAVGGHYEYSGQNAGTITLYNSDGDKSQSLDYEVDAVKLSLLFNSVPLEFSRVVAD